MGRECKWLRSLFRFKKSPPAKAGREWGSSAEYQNHVRDPLASPYVEGLDASKHAIVVAAATAAVAEAALAAAHAAAEVVKLTSGGASGRSATTYVTGEPSAVCAAVRIQSAFRAYLARRALRALKSLVKLQALVRGHTVRKQTADVLRRMQAMARIQARASADRSYSSASTAKIKFSHSFYPQNHTRWRIDNNANKEGFHLASKRVNRHWIGEYDWSKVHANSLASEHGDEAGSDKILEVDTWKPHLSRDNRNERTETTETARSPYFPTEGSWNPRNSTRPTPSSSTPTPNRRGPFSPARSECSRSLHGDYISHPNYMANTKASRAKLRSHSAPKQRMQLQAALGWKAKFGDHLWESECHL